MIEEEFGCKICRCLLVEPIVFPCAHVVCHTCYQSIEALANMQCPFCRLRLSTWARKHAKNLVDLKLWRTIQQRYPRECSAAIGGEIVPVEFADEAHPARHQLVEPGSLRAEWQESLSRERTTREQERKQREESEWSKSQALIESLVKENEEAKERARQEQERLELDRTVAVQLQKELEAATAKAKAPQPVVKTDKTLKAPVKGPTAKPPAAESPLLKLINKLKTKPPLPPGSRFLADSSRPSSGVQREAQCPICMALVPEEILVRHANSCESFAAGQLTESEPSGVQGFALLEELPSTSAHEPAVELGTVAMETVSERSSSPNLRASAPLSLDMVTLPSSSSEAIAGNNGTPTSRHTNTHSSSREVTSATSATNSTVITSVALRIPSDSIQQSPTKSMVPKPLASGLHRWLVVGTPQQSSATRAAITAKSFGDLSGRPGLSGLNITPVLDFTEVEDELADQLDMAQRFGICFRWFERRFVPSIQFSFSSVFVETRGL
eukprot:m.191837 g.191837  ORF g.191837 m.191837 type:complete len:498 (-) comp53642_c0_seq1:28-1521(-)